MGVLVELADNGLYGCRTVVSFDRGKESNCGRTVLCLPSPREPPPVPSAPPSEHSCQPLQTIIYTLLKQCARGSIQSNTVPAFSACTSFTQGVQVTSCPQIYFVFGNRRSGKNLFPEIVHRRLHGMMEVIPQIQRTISLLQSGPVDGHVIFAVCPLIVAIADVETGSNTDIGLQFQALRRVGI